MPTNLPPRVSAEERNQYSSVKDFVRWVFSTLMVYVGVALASGVGFLVAMGGWSLRLTTGNTSPSVALQMWILALPLLFICDFAFYYSRARDVINFRILLAGAVFAAAVGYFVPEWSGWVLGYPTAP